MKRRSKRGAKAVKTESGNPAKSGHAIPSEAMRGRRPTMIRQETDTARLTRERDEAVQWHDAIGEILSSISESMADPRPVFDAIVRNLIRLFGTGFAVVTLIRNDTLELVGIEGEPGFDKLAAHYPVPLNNKTLAGKVIALGEPIQLAPIIDNPESPPSTEQWARQFNYNSQVSVPLIRHGIAIGAISTSRRSAEAFTQRQVDLVQNFAAQAVIAIENARLLNELRQRTDDLSEALEQQTATSDVLRTISSSPGELEPVFTAMLENAVRLCDAKFGIIYRWDGHGLNLIAAHNTPPTYAELRKAAPFHPGPDTATGRMIVSKTTTQVVDLAKERGYLERDPMFVSGVEIGGIRTLLSVPMLKEDALIGAFSIYRDEVQPFTEKQIKLVQNFAAQAVIAIENARLLNELRQRTEDLSESLEQQTATSEVLRVISGSPTDIRPVLDAVAQNAARLCEATNAVIFHLEDGLLRQVAAYGQLATSSHPAQGLPIDRETVTGRAVLERRTIHVYDLAAEESEYPQGSKHARIDGHRTTLATPMLREGAPVGAILIRRTEVRPFSDKQVHLVTTFADQAAIAIENVRLFNELNKLNHQLEERVADQVGEIERMSRLRRFLPPQIADLIVASGTEKQLESHRREITALFCDLRGFTGFSESSDPEDVMALLRDYHAAIGKIIIKYSGTLERYAGDGVMVVFNDPVPVENPALQAVLMALEMRHAIAALTETWRRWGHDIGFGIGIAHGFATLGTIGFEGRFDYAAIGTVSNVASRLCDEAKPGQILISPRVLTKIENAVTVEPAGEFVLKGIRRPMMAYNVLEASSSKPN